jgi:4,5-dihydroxyphthalate decarboxylase
MAVGDYDLHRALITGAVGITGCEAVVIGGLSSPERHWRALRHEEFDVCELSLGSYLAALHQGRWVAVPVFPHRRFRHHYFFVRRDADIGDLRGLAGCRVGLMTWQATAGIWMRGLMTDAGVELASIRWYSQYEEFVPTVRPPVALERAPRDLEAMLLDGELDAVLYPETLPSFRRGDPRVRRLFAAPLPEEQRYFLRTRVFPPMHVLALRRSLAEAHPWLPERLVEGWEASKRAALARLATPGSLPLAWQEWLWETERRLLGPDPWQTGLTIDNLAALTALCRYAFEQGILDRPLDPSALFWSGRGR